MPRRRCPSNIAFDLTDAMERHLLWRPVPARSDQRDSAEQSHSRSSPLSEVAQIKSAQVTPSSIWSKVNGGKHACINVSQNEPFGSGHHDRSLDCSRRAHVGAR